MAIEIRLLQDNELTLANDFFNRIYQITRSFEDFEWEFIKGPKGKAIYVVAFDTEVKISNRIVGIQCAIPLDLTDAKGNYILTAKSEDTLVDPAYRGQKIFERMYALLFDECKKAGIQYIWGFTPALKAFERIGFEAPFKTQQGLLSFNPLKSFSYLKRLNSSNTFIDKVKILALSWLSFIKGLTRMTLPLSKYSISHVNFEDKEKVIKKLFHQSPYYFIKQDLNYQQWRLVLNPFKNNYKNYQFEDDKKNIIADVLVNVKNEVSYIEQFYFDKNLSVQEKKKLLRTIIAEIQKSKAPFIRALCFDINDELRSQISLLKSVGFTILNRGNFFVWKSLDPENKIDPKQIFLSRLFTQGNQ